MFCFFFSHTSNTSTRITHQFKGRHYNAGEEAGDGPLARFFTGKMCFFDKLICPVHHRRNRFTGGFDLF